ncbi:MAG: hypothetical protein ABJH07_23405 [Sedimentitalea sp.]|uniref:hypothetical protein n=1 Tax=Sedimentitalea sp. TaxID=2048915 RepID=UPI003267E766
MKRQLFVHIGAHRTATSALQKYLFQNFQPLIGQGFLYPLGVRRHVGLISDLFSGLRDPKAVALNLERRAADKANDIHALILSDEDICMRKDLRVLAKFREQFDVKVVFTLRRQDTWLESWYLQNVKWQWNPKLMHRSFEDFLKVRKDFHWIHYDRYVKHLEKLFGRENVILNIYEKQQMTQGPIEMFCDSIGLTDRSAFKEPDHINASYSPLISEFMRRLPLNEAPEGFRDRLNMACAEVDRSLASGTKQSERMIPHAQRVALMAEYERGNRALAERYFGRDALFLEPLPGPEVPLADRSLPADSDVLMRDFVAPLVRELIRDQKAEVERQAARTTKKPVAQKKKTA